MYMQRSRVNIRVVKKVMYFMALSLINEDVKEGNYNALKSQRKGIHNLNSKLLGR